MAEEALSAEEIARRNELIRRLNREYLISNGFGFSFGGAPASYLNERLAEMSENWTVFERPPIGIVNVIECAFIGSSVNIRNVQAATVHGNLVTGPVAQINVEDSKGASVTENLVLSPSAPIKEKKS